MTPLRVPLDGRVTGMPWDEIDTVVFDVGNVLLSFNPEKTLEELFPEDAEKRQIMLDTDVPLTVLGHARSRHAVAGGGREGHGRPASGAGK